jgi:hypothetical protein
MEEIKKSRISVVVHSFAAIVMGLASVYIASVSRTLFAGIAGIIVLIVLGLATKRASKTEIKWWLSNGAAVFVLVWFVSWVVFHNIGVLP